MEKKKQIITAVCISAVLIVVLVLCFVFGRKKEGGTSEGVYVEPVSILGSSGMGTQNRYAGVVEAQESWKINLDSSKKVKEVYVKVGDEVAEGDQLFAYDTQELNAQIAQQKLEMESITNEIEDCNAQIAALQAERDAAASEDAKFDYTTEIQSVQNDLKQAQYNKKSKQLEIDQLNESIKNSVVTSKMAGVVKTLNENQSNEQSTDEAFMTILATGDYRVKCMINEQNMMDIGEGAPVILRSRVDENQTWTGIIAQIDTEAPQSSNSNSMYMESSGGDETTSSSKYPFYVTLEQSEGLMLGQHVFVEMDYGQGVVKNGVWLYETYLVKDGKDTYVWADNGKGKLEKRKVEPGDYDEALGEYEIKSGLSKEDYVAWPEETLKEGVKTIKDTLQTDEDEK